VLTDVTVSSLLPFSPHKYTSQVRFRKYSSRRNCIEVAHNLVSSTRQTKPRSFRGVYWSEDTQIAYTILEGQAPH
jgi:hypothetical protein